ncbi:MAG: T9SS type A sorting domain-containing protein [Bacteroidota bacterium]
MNLLHTSMIWLLLFLSVKLSSQNRDCDLVIMEGIDLPCMLHEQPDDIVAFKFIIDEGWIQVPIQIDEQVLLDISAPYNNAPCIGGKGTDSEISWNIRFYADTTTFIGADTLPTFDEDDELVFMAKDLGEQSAIVQNPTGTLDRLPCELSVYDSLDDVQLGYLYLFIQDGTLSQAAGQSYVSYDFVFFPTGNNVAGSTVKEDYIPCYNNLEYNRESSTVQTAVYEAGFSTRWKETMLKIKAGNSTGVDILDLHQGTLNIEKCVRTTTTYSNNRGIIVNAINRPIRSIRSIMGSNSGPFNQVTYYFSECQVNYETDFRVHNNNEGVSDVYDIFDFNENMMGATYVNEYNLTPIPIDGIQDQVDTEKLPEWSFYKGDAGAIAIAASLKSNMLLGESRETIENRTAELTSKSYYDDNTPTAMYICTGDQKAYGSSGFVFISDQCTDIRYNNPACIASIDSPRVAVMNRIHYYLPPETSQEEGKRYASFALTPLAVTMSDASYIPDRSLPVDLLYFSAKAVESDVLLEWAVASELNFEKYNVERSLDAKNFKTIANVAGRADNITAADYIYTDKKAKKGMWHYYRLKMIDQDGSFEYSNIQAVKLSQFKRETEIYPNPSRHLLNLKIQSLNTYSTDLYAYDLNNRAIWLGKLNIQKGINQIRVNTENLNSGSYTLVFREMNGQLRRLRLVIAK